MGDNQNFGPGAGTPQQNSDAGEWYMAEGFVEKTEAVPEALTGIEPRHAKHEAPSAPPAPPVRPVQRVQPAAQAAPRQAEAPVYGRPQPQQTRKGFPVFGIPAIIILSMMVAVFLLNLLLSMEKFNAVKGILNSPFVGSRNYEYVLSNRDTMKALSDTLVTRLLILGTCGALSAGLCALYYAMKKPGTVLTFTCLWLIPLSLPTASIAIPAMRSLASMRIYETGYIYLFAVLLQTVSLFCFTGGIFTYLGILKNGRAGKGPFYGLLIAVLAWMLGGISVNGLYSGIGTPLSRTRLLDEQIFRLGLQNGNFAAAGALSVIKVCLQFAIGLVPMIVLCILARRKSTKGKTTLMVLWLFLAGVMGTVLALISGSLARAVNEMWISAVLNSLTIALAGGAMGGLVVYSFVHLMRRSASFLYGVIALILSAAMSCIIAQYLVVRNMGMVNTFLPQVLFAAFDWRLLILAVALSFALRSHMESRPGSFALSLALLTGAFTWGELTVPMTYLTNRNLTTVVMRNYQLLTSTVQNAAAMDVATSANSAAVLASQRAIGQVLLAVPPLLLGLGAALLMKRALKETPTL